MDRNIKEIVDAAKILKKKIDQCFEGRLMWHVGEDALRHELWALACQVERTIHVARGEVRSYDENQATIKDLQEKLKRRESLLDKYAEDEGKLFLKEQMMKKQRAVIKEDRQ